MKPSRIAYEVAEVIRAKYIRHPGFLARRVQLAMDEYEPTNREKSIYAKLGLGWCHGCDRALIGDWGKCPVCGKKMKPKKLKPSRVSGV